MSSDCLDKLEQVFTLLELSLLSLSLFSKSMNFKILRDMIPRDCWPIGPGEGHWYGGGERLVRFSSSDFQLNFAKDRSKSHFHPLSSSRIAVVVEWVALYPSPAAPNFVVLFLACYHTLSNWILLAPLRIVCQTLSLRTKERNNCFQYIMPRQDLRSTYFSPHVVFVSRFFFIVILGRLEIWFVTLWLIPKYPKQKRNVSETVQLNSHPLQNTTWPLGDTATVRLTPFVTGDEAKTEWGNVIRKVCFQFTLFLAHVASVSNPNSFWTDHFHIIIVVDVWFDKNETQINHFQLWINSKGLTIAVDDDSPLSVSINDPEVTHLVHFKTSPIELPFVRS